MMLRSTTSLVAVIAFCFGVAVGVLATLTFARSAVTPQFNSADHYVPLSNGYVMCLFDGAPFIVNDANNVVVGPEITAIGGSDEYLYGTLKFYAPKLPNRAASNVFFIDLKAKVVHNNITLDELFRVFQDNGVASIELWSPHQYERRLQPSSF